MKKIFSFVGEHPCLVLSTIALTTIALLWGAAGMLLLPFVYILWDKAL